MKLEELLKKAVSQRASDIHFKVGEPPVVKLFGELFGIKSAPIKPNQINELVQTVLDGKSQKPPFTFDEMLTTMAIEGVGRFRVNIYRCRGEYSISIRCVPMEIPVFETLNIPKSILEFTKKSSGIVFISGGCGSGKTTTISSVVEYMNHNRKGHIVLIQEPIEFIHKDARCIINQREIGFDTKSVEISITNASRHHCDIIGIDETINEFQLATLFRAAESGKLVFATIKTPTVIETLAKIMNAFSNTNRDIATQIITRNLLGIVSQKLIKRKDRSGEIPAVEILINNQTISSAIRDNRLDDIEELMSAESDENGMTTFGQSIEKLRKIGVID